MNIHAQASNAVDFKAEGRDTYWTDDATIFQAQYKVFWTPQRNCIEFTPERLYLYNTSYGWGVAFDVAYLRHFSTTGEAQKLLNFIKDYSFNQHCFVNKFGNVKHVLALSSGLEADRMEYFLKDGTAPTLHDIKYVDSTCKKINPNSISTAMINSHWHVKSSDFDQDFYSNQELAENTAYAIRNYDFNYYCPSLGFMKTTANITTSPS